MLVLMAIVRVDQQQVIVEARGHYHDHDHSHRHLASDIDEDIHFAKLLPKIELHAHLSGSIPNTTLTELLQEKNLQHENKCHSWEHDTNECFGVFGLLHRY